jgi:hypothetical protein
MGRVGYTCAETSCATISSNKLHHNVDLTGSSSDTELLRLRSRGCGCAHRMHLILSVETVRKHFQNHSGIWSAGRLKRLPISCKAK